MARHREPLPLDERGRGPQQGEEYLRDPGAGMSDGWGVELGLTVWRNLIKTIGFDRQGWRWGGGSFGLLF